MIAPNDAAKELTVFHLPSSFRRLSRATGSEKTKKSKPPGRFGLPTQ
jgi:hypothetical protein